jgi:hypothetical protein
MFQQHSFHLLRLINNENFSRQFLLFFMQKRKWNNEKIMQISFKGEKVNKYHNTVRTTASSRTPIFCPWITISHRVLVKEKTPRLDTIRLEKFCDICLVNSWPFKAIYIMFRSGGTGEFNVE